MPSCAMIGERASPAPWSARRRSRPRPAWCSRRAGLWCLTRAPAAASAAGRPRPPNSPSRSNGAAQKCGPSPITALPAALTTASAPTVMPSRVSAEAEPRPPLRSAVVAPSAGADAAEREIGCGAGGRRIAELAIGRIAAPVLVAAVEQVEQDRRRHDRHPRGAHLQSRGLVRAARPARRRRHRGQRPSRRTARWRRCARPSSPDRAGRFRACPGRRRAGRPPRPPARRTARR